MDQMHTNWWTSESDSNCFDNLYSDVASYFKEPIDITSSTVGGQVVVKDLANFVHAKHVLLDIYWGRPVIKLGSHVSCSIEACLSSRVDASQIT